MWTNSNKVSHCTRRGQFIKGALLWYKYSKWWSCCNPVIVFKNMFHRKSACREKFMGSLTALAWKWLAGAPFWNNHVTLIHESLPRFSQPGGGEEVHQPPRYTLIQARYHIISLIIEPYPVWAPYHRLAGAEDQIPPVVPTSMEYPTPVPTTTRQITSTVAQIRILRMYQTAIITPSTWE